MTLTAEQIETRRGGLTATDMTKITGVSHYGGAIDVLLDKQGVESEFIPTDRVKWGNLLEGPIRDDYAERHQVTIEVPGTLIHPDEPWAMATPDGIVGVHPTQGPAGILRGWEGKTHTNWMGHLYGDPGTDEVPAWELVQCAWNTWIASAHYGVQIDRWDLTVFMDNLPTDYVIERDPELEEMLVETGRTFWQEHVLGGVPLEPDGSEFFSKDLARRFARHGEAFKPADKAALESIEALRCIRGEIKDMEKDEASLVQHLKAFIAEDAGVEFPGDKEKPDRITWRRSKDSVRTDWKLLAESYRLAAIEAGVAPDKLAGLLGIYTAPKPGSRRFVVPRAWNK